MPLKLANNIIQYIAEENIFDAFSEVNRKHLCLVVWQRLLFISISPEEDTENLLLLSQEKKKQVQSIFSQQSVRSHDFLLIGDSVKGISRA